MVTITRYIFINIFKVEYFSAVKFDIGYEKILAFLWYKNVQKFEEKLKILDWASLRAWSPRAIMASQSHPDS